MKKSGLADSPFFNPPETKPTPQPEQVETPAPGNETLDTPLPDNSDAGHTNQAYQDENQDQKRSNERTTERTIVRTILKPKREKIRHTFDIYQDQLVALQVVQLEAVQSGKKKPKLGKMVSEGIDLYLKQIASKKKRA